MEERGNSELWTKTIHENFVLKNKNEAAAACLLGRNIDENS